ncbi:MAG: AmmeMemoRadiSam system protein B [Bacteroidales bacterium]|jgi:AmmeMemoRadiSam system protein B
MNKSTFFLTFLILILLSITVSAQRKQVDTVGFAKYGWQMNLLFSRISQSDKAPVEEFYKAAICPHDDYAYAGGLYAKTLAGIKAQTVILIGVAHKAKKFGLENKLVFDSFDEWKCAGRDIKVSALRKRLLQTLSPGSFVIHDSIMQVEHSLEAITPFLQRNSAWLDIVPILVPQMTFENMELFSEELAQQVFAYMREKRLSFGRDLAIVISNDALHYGDEDWGGANLAPFGTDDAGTKKAVAKDLMIIDDCLKGEVMKERIRKFYDYTVSADDFREYNWTWCGRYSVPFGMLFAEKLNQLYCGKPLTGEVTGYRSSITTPHIEVKDLKMGTTAPANQRHWVSYIGVRFM